jgi:hypothetical protein
MHAASLCINHNHRGTPRDSQVIVVQLPGLTVRHTAKAVREWMNKRG